MHVNKSSLGAF